MELFELSAIQLSKMLQKKEVSSTEVVQSFNRRIEETDPMIKSFITRCPQEALQAARVVDDRRAAGEKMHPLAGVPVAVKDNISTDSLPTTCASKILDNYVPQFDATVVSVLRRTGMPILGKTNLDEFAMGSSTENSAFFATSNPWDLDRVPGGSSGGSAAAVAMRQAPLAIGSDTGGSVRQPASFCGVGGLRPTYGRISRYGLIAFASSLDQIGTFARDAAAGMALFSLLAGHDSLDSTSLNEPVATDADLSGEEDSIKGLKVGFIEVEDDRGFDPQVMDKTREIADYMQSCGAEVERLSSPLTDYALSAYYLISPAEVSSNLGRYDGIRYGYSTISETDSETAMLGIKEVFSRTRGEGLGPEVKRRIMLGTYALSAGYFDAYYLQAVKVRTLIRQEMEEAFQKYDILLGPITPTPAFRLGEKTKDPMQMYLSDVCTLSAALAGCPAISVPCGYSAEGLPLGVQLTAPPLQEPLLFKAEAVVEKKAAGCKPPEQASGNGKGGVVGEQRG